jgi:hypothetical protein
MEDRLVGDGAVVLKNVVVDQTLRLCNLRHS